MASSTQWTRVSASSRRWWEIRKPGVLQSMGLQRVGHDWVTEQLRHMLVHALSNWQRLERVFSSVLKPSSQDRPRRKAKLHLVFPICILTILAKSWVSQSQTNTQEPYVTGLEIVRCFVECLNAWTFSWGWQVNYCQSNPFCDQLLLNQSLWVRRWVFWQLLSAWPMPTNFEVLTFEVPWLQPLLHAHISH